MATQRTRDTAPEIALRKELFRRGLRYRVDEVLPLTGIRRRSDVTFRRAKVAVFVDSCFWHVCPDHQTWPKANADWWAAKLARNVERDRDTDERLREAGWTVCPHVGEREGCERAADAHRQSCPTLSGYRSVRGLLLASERFKLLTRSRRGRQSRRPAVEPARPPALALECAGPGNSVVAAEPPNAALVVIRRLATAFAAAPTRRGLSCRRFNSSSSTEICDRSCDGASSASSSRRCRPSFSRTCKWTCRISCSTAARMEALSASLASRPLSSRIQ